MRSCLIQLLILVVVVFALLWFGLPVGASWLATNALNASGFSGTDTKVSGVGEPAAPPADRPRRLHPPDLDPGRHRGPACCQHRPDPRQRGPVERKIGTVDGHAAREFASRLRTATPSRSTSVTLVRRRSNGDAQMACRQPRSSALAETQLKSQGRQRRQ